VPVRPLFCVCAIALLAPCFANQQVLSTGGSLDVRLQSAEPILPTQAGPMVRGVIQVSPHPIKPVCDRIVFYVDDQKKLATDAPGAKLLLDTAQLTEGEHELRVEAERAGKLFISTGTIAFQVANQEGAAVLQAAVRPAPPNSPAFAKLYRARVSYEAIWFDGEEGDLERHAYIDEDRMYITLTDLLRHIGGRLIWGPDAEDILIERDKVSLTLVPGSTQAHANGEPVDLGKPVVVRGSRTFVPVRAMCEQFGIRIEWNEDERRAYVFAPQPGYGVEVATYPWVSPVTGDRTTGAPGRLAFRNLTSRPIHVLLQGNGFRADWQIRGRATLPGVYVAPGTYRITLWSSEGSDLNEYITVAAGARDRYDISLSSISLISR